MSTPPAELTSIDVDHIAAAISAHLRFALLLAGRLGLRESEVLALRRGDVDLPARQLTVAAALTPEGVLIEHKDSPRVHDLSARLVEGFRHHLEEVGELDEAQFLFANRDGEPLRPQQLSHDFDGASAKAGYHGLHFHDLHFVAEKLVHNAE